jgi:hypothetical protein
MAIASGRATKISPTARSSPSQAMAASELGKLSRPRSTNITIWAIHAAPSWKMKMPRRKTMSALPITSPAR